MLARSVLVMMLFMGAGALVGWADDTARQEPRPPASETKPSDAKGAERKADQPKPSDAKVAEKERRESIAWAFVMLHHPELAEVLSRLKLMNPGEFDRALVQVFATTERLNKLQKDEAQRAELELQAWKVDSRIRLLAARMAVSLSDSHDREMLAALTEQNKIRIQLLQADRERMLVRAKSLEVLIKKGKDEEKKDVDNRFQDVLREVNKQRAKQGLKTADKTVAPNAAKVP